MSFDRRYLDLFIRWSWLIALAAVVAGGISFWVTSQEPVDYEAKARLLVGPGVESAKITLNDLRTSAQLMQTYAEMAQTRPVMQEVVDSLKLDIEPGRLGGRVEAKTNTETLILTIQARARNPKQAADIANAVAEALVRMPGSSSADLIASVRDEAAELKAAIERSDVTIAQLEGILQASTDLEQQRLLRDQIKDERNRQTTTHQSLARLYESLQVASTNQIKIIEPAVEASRIDNGAQLNVLVAALAGVVVASMIAVAVEFLDRRIKSADQLAEATGAPVLAAIERHAPLAGVGREGLVVRTQPDSGASEGYRLLGARLLLGIGAAAPRTVLVCGIQSGAADDSAEVAANLAVTLADAGHRVALVDADLHARGVGALFGLEDRPGLTEALGGKGRSIEPINAPWAPGLGVVASGAAVADGFKLLASPGMDAWLKGLAEQSAIVILAAAPVLAHAESLVLAARADEVVLVARSGKVGRDAASEAVAQLRALGLARVGLVLSQARKGEAAAAPPSAMPLALGGAVRPEVAASVGGQ